jgi:hypothetical protein
VQAGLEAVLEGFKEMDTDRWAVCVDYFLEGLAGLTDEMEDASDFAGPRQRRIR